ncbi:hypothetical protein P6U16_08405 [Rhizobium sp. 32-5/1]|uniref:head-tail joining protein n=1 Tax=Rhizobium sp. 32-5/1 TaxID=3019602 RepID=UPI00240E92C3|nr:hypothetical protein [Rhizobium sp. 32-5/1]WEZ84581.1 hypothetical protein P6U16_08405 [Rhizobium sp. 32-5/1]
MGSAFSRAFGNTTAVFTINGVVGLPVPIILRNGRDLDEGEEQGQGLEARTYSLAVAATDVAGLISQRDTMTFEGTVYPIVNHTDDAHAMLRVFLRGEI